MSSYSEKLKDPRWQKKRLEIMNRDGFRCRDCGSDTDTLHVHHCHYAKGDPWETPDEFLLTVCELCHEFRGTLEPELKEAFAAMLAQYPAQMLFESLEKIRAGDGLIPMHLSYLLKTENIRQQIA